MTAQHPGRDEVPEEDLLEQQAPVEPPPAPDLETVTDLADTVPDVAADDADQADEADRLAQHEVVPGADEEDYPHEA